VGLAVIRHEPVNEAETDLAGALEEIHNVIEIGATPVEALEAGNDELLLAVDLLLASLGVRAYGGDCGAKGDRGPKGDGGPKGYGRTKGRSRHSCVHAITRRIIPEEFRPLCIPANEIYPSSRMGDSPPPGYSGGSTYDAPPVEIPMTRMQGGGGMFNSPESSLLDTSSLKATIPMTEFKGGGTPPKAVPSSELSPKAVPSSDVPSDEEITHAVMTSIIAAIDVPEAPPSSHAPLGKQRTKQLKNGLRVRLNLPDNVIKGFLDPADPGFKLGEEKLFRSLMFAENDVRMYLQNNQADYVQFWKDYVEFDGSDPIVRATHVKGRSLNRFLENIHQNRITFLTQSIGKLLRRNQRKQYYMPRESFDGDYLKTIAELPLYKPHIEKSLPPIYQTRIPVVSQYSMEDHERILKNVEDTKKALDGILPALQGGQKGPDPFVAYTHAQTTFDTFNKTLDYYSDELAALNGLRASLEGYMSAANEAIIGKEAIVATIQKGQGADADLIMGLKYDVDNYKALLMEYDKYLTITKEKYAIHDLFRKDMNDKRQAAKAALEELKGRFRVTSAEAKAAAKAPLNIPVALPVTNANAPPPNASSTARAKADKQTGGKPKRVTRRVGKRRTA
jgi:hypothetical protein